MYQFGNTCISEAADDLCFGNLYKFSQFYWHFRHSPIFNMRVRLLWFSILQLYIELAWKSSRKIQTSCDCVNWSCSEHYTAGACVWMWPTLQQHRRSRKRPTTGSTSCRVDKGTTGEYHRVFLSTPCLLSAPGS